MYTLCSYMFLFIFTLNSHLLAISFSSFKSWVQIPVWYKPLSWFPYSSHFHYFPFPPSFFPLSFFPPPLLCFLYLLCCFLWNFHLQDTWKSIRAILMLKETFSDLERNKIVIFSMEFWQSIADCRKSQKGNPFENRKLNCRGLPIPGFMFSARDCRNERVWKKTSFIEQRTVTISTVVKQYCGLE